jgi:hypothetical protein
MADKSFQPATVPVSAMMMLVLAAGGTWLYFSSLTSSRPPPQASEAYGTIGNQDVDARLWQDPFKAVQARRLTAATTRSSGPVPRGEPFIMCGRHDLEDIRRQIVRQQQEAAAQGSGVLVLPVIVSAGPYGELAELRLRTRVAVLEALSACGLEPVDGDHIGYFGLGWDWNTIPVPTEASFKHLKQTAQAKPGDNPLVIPYEWCKESIVKIAGIAEPKAPEYARVLILWVESDAMSDLPLSRLAAIEDALDPQPLQGPSSLKAITWKIVGPKDSDGLHDVVSEASSSQPAKSSVLQRLRDTVLYSGTATARDEILLYGVATEPKNDTTVSRYVRRRCCVAKGRGLRLVRTTPDDTALSAALIDELERRGLRVRSAWQGGYSDGDDTHQMDDVAVVAELDTFYGRALPMSFAAEAQKQATLSDLLRERRFFPPWIHPFVYLRGLDGKAPGDEQGGAPPKKETNSAQSTAGYKTEAPQDAVDGVSQSDYLRRLAEQLAALDESIRRDDPTGKRRLKAVGVLGTDVYDKLLVLRALRDRLPAVTFFTTGLDARYLAPAELDGTEGLIIASAFGQRLHLYYQHNIPPFRDSDQTAVFVSVQTAMGRMKVATEGDHPSPRLFQIGRTSAHDISVGPDKELNPYGQAAETHDAMREAPPTVHPPRYDLSHFPQFTEPWLVALLFAGGICAAPLLIGARPQHANLGRFFASTTVAIIFACAIVFVWLIWQLNNKGPEEEPWALADGVSVWPTEAIRLFTGLLCIHFIAKSFIQSDCSDREVESHFKLRPLSEFNAVPTQVMGGKPEFFRESSKKPIFWLDRWRVFGDTNGNPTPAPVPLERDAGAPPDPARPKVFAQNLWWQYQRRGLFSARLARVLIMTLLYYALCLSLLTLFGFPVIHARGPLTRAIDEYISLYWAAPLSILVTFFVLDATYLNRRFIRYLMASDTLYPEGAFKRYAWCVDPDDLIEYQDIRFIALRSRVVGDVIYYPFVIFLLLLIARISLFAQWDWPAGVILILGGNLALAIIGALMLRHAAEDARRQALRRLRTRIRLKSTTPGSERQVKVLQEVETQIENEREGAFSILSQHPAIAAILLPSGSIGIWALLEYLPKLIR